MNKIFITTYIYEALTYYSHDIYIYNNKYKIIFLDLLCILNIYFKLFQL